MSDTQVDTTKFWLRIVSGILAVVTMLLVIFRMMAGGDSFMYFLRLIFPLSLSLLFGYIAWKGSLPFAKKS